MVQRNHGRSSGSAGRDRSSRGDRGIRSTLVRFISSWWPIVYLLLFCAGAVLLHRYGPLPNLILAIAASAALVVIIFVWVGNQTAGHDRFVQPYKGIWTTLVLICLFTVIANVAGYEALDGRRTGISASTQFAGETVKRLHTSTSELVKSLEELEADLESHAERTDVEGAKRELIAAEEGVRAATMDPEQAGMRLMRAQARLQQAEHEYPLAFDAVERSLQNVEQLTNQGVIGTERALSGVHEALMDRSQKLSVKGQLEMAQSVLSTTRQPYQDLRPDLDSTRKAWQEAKDGQASISYLRDRLQRPMLRMRAAARAALVNTEIAQASLSAANAEVVVTVAWLGLLCSTLVIFPWVLFLLFIFRKREDLADQIAEDLGRLDPNGGLLERALGAPQTKSPAGTTAEAGIGQGPAASRLARRVAGRAPGNAQNREDWERVRTQLTIRAFSNFEYSLILVVLTVLTAIGWFFIFYPHTTTGLQRLIEQDQGSKGLSRYLTDGLTPITMGFVGAYFYAMQMLVRRYLAGDLYPSAFLQAVVRILAVFILTLLLGVAYTPAGPDPAVTRQVAATRTVGAATPTPTATSSTSAGPGAAAGGIVSTAAPSPIATPTPTGASGLTQVARDVVAAGRELGGVGREAGGVARELGGVAMEVGAFGGGIASHVTVPLAFFIGIFPDAFLQLAASWVNRRFRARFQEGVEVAPLTKLDGLSIWHQARLLEENVENVEAMAMCPIDRLVLRTYFSIGQIVDWVDQAILYMHAGDHGEWFAPLRKVGIRTSTDLLNATGLNLLDPGHLRYRDFWPNSQALGRVVAAVNAAPASTPTEGDRSIPGDGPKLRVRTAAARAHALSVKLVATSESTASLSAQINKDQPATLDRAIRVGELVAEAHRATRDLIGKASTLTQASRASADGTTSTSATRDGIASAANAMRAVASQMGPLMDEVEPLIQSMTIERLALRDLTTLKERLDQLASGIASIDLHLRTLDSFATVPDDPVKAVSTAIASARRAVEVAREGAATLNLDRPESLDAREDLKTRAEQLRRLARALENSYQELERAVEELSTTEPATPQLIEDLQSGRQAILKASRAADEAQKLALELRKDDLSTLPAARASFDELARATRLAQYAVEQATSTLQERYQLGLLTVEILHVICDAIWPDMNLQYILNYYSEIGESLVGRFKARANGEVSTNGRSGLNGRPGADVRLTSRVVWM